jgi:hypothetical protein
MALMLLFKYLPFGIEEKCRRHDSIIATGNKKRECRRHESILLKNHSHYFVKQNIFKTPYTDYKLNPTQHEKTSTADFFGDTVNEHSYVSGKNNF